MTGVGIVVWYSRDLITKEDYEASKFKAKSELYCDSWTGGYSRLYHSYKTA